MVVVDPKYTVASKRLLIRPLDIEDAQDIHSMRSDPEVMKFTSTGNCPEFERTVAWIQDCLRRDNCWNFSVELLPAIDETAGEEDTAAPRVIGIIGAIRTPEVGYLFNSRYHGKGYATEALQAFLPLYFEHYSTDEHGVLDYSEAHVDTEHTRSKRVLLKAGFELIERRENDFQNLMLGLRSTLIYRNYRPTHAENTGE